MNAIEVRQHEITRLLFGAQRVGADPVSGELAKLLGPLCADTTDQ